MRKYPKLVRVISNSSIFFIFFSLLLPKWNRKLANTHTHPSKLASKVSAINIGYSNSFALTTWSSFLFLFCFIVAKICHTEMGFTLEKQMCLLALLVLLFPLLCTSQESFTLSRASHYGGPDYYWSQSMYKFPHTYIYIYIVLCTSRICTWHFRQSVYFLTRQKPAAKLAS